MGHSSKRKAAFGVLSLAVAALVADKTLLSGKAPGPQTASAAQAADKASPPARGADDKHTPSGVALSEWLSQYRVKTGLDIGSTPDSFNQARFIAGAAENIVLADPVALEKPDLDFVSSHTLHFVLLSDSPGASVVRVNGRRLRIGDTVDGYTLVKIAPRWAGFEAGGRRVALALQEPKLHSE